MVHTNTQDGEVASHLTSSVGRVYKSTDTNVCHSEADQADLSN